MKRSILFVATLLLAVGCSKQEYKITECEGVSFLTQKRGPKLGYCDVDILYVDGNAFKDHNRNGNLDIYEDWRKTPAERAADLVAQMPVEYLSGLMTNGHTVNVPGYSSMSVSGILYNGKPFQLRPEACSFD